MEKREDNYNETAGQSPEDNVSGNEFPMLGNKQPRYSDAELAEFKEIVLNRLSEAKADYDMLRGTLHRRNEAEETGAAKGTDEAGERFSKEEISQLAVRQARFIENLQGALARIENKSYGICRISGKLIAKERLRNAPHTTMCLDAKLEMSRLN
jgi:RNA polymerase-binding transcription factor DksA